MGKGIIKVNRGDYTYDVQLVLDRSGAREYDDRITELTGRIAALDDGPEKSGLKLQLLATEKARDLYLEKVPAEDPVVTAWCADLSAWLPVGYVVGTIEVPGERGTVLIYPTWFRWEYDATLDGILKPSALLSPAGSFYNLAMLPGWQKWKPTYRFATVTAVDLWNQTMNLDLLATVSSQQDLDVNQTASLAGVPAEYMDYGVFAFVAGDVVVVEFTGQDWSQPKVIGFRDNPRGGKPYLWISVKPHSTDKASGAVDRHLLYDVLGDQVADDIYNPAGGLVSFPCAMADLAWFSEHNGSLSSKASCGRAVTGRPSYVASYDIPLGEEPCCQDVPVGSDTNQIEADSIGFEGEYVDQAYVDAAYDCYWDWYGGYSYRCRFQDFYEDRWSDIQAYSSGGFYNSGVWSATLSFSGRAAKMRAAMYQASYAEYFDEYENCSGAGPCQEQTVHTMNSITTTTYTLYDHQGGKVAEFVNLGNDPLSGTVTCVGGMDVYGREYDAVTFLFYWLKFQPVKDDVDEGAPIIAVNAFMATDWRPNNPFTAPASGSLSSAIESTLNSAYANCTRSRFKPSVGVLAYEMVAVQ